MYLPENSPEDLYIERAAVLNHFLPHLDITKTAAYLSNIAPNKRDALKQGNFSSLAFDVVFSPGIIPKSTQFEYRRAYQSYFKELHNLQVFDPETEEFIYPNENDFHLDQKQGANHDQFFAEWIANFRAVALMKQLLGVEANMPSVMTSNVIEAGLCRMAENGEEWPDNLLHAMPISMQERLDRIRKEIEKELKEGRVLSPGQFFRVANELEFHEREFLRGNVHDRTSMIMEAIDETTHDERFSALPPAPVSQMFAQARSKFGLDFQPAIDWHKASPRQIRQINLHAFLRDEESASGWTNVMLGLSPSGSIPPLR